MRSVSEQHTEMVIFMWKRSQSLGYSNEKQIRTQGALGQICTDRVAENYFAEVESSEVCELVNQKGWDLKNKTEVKTAVSGFTNKIENNGNIGFKIALRNKENSHHIMAVIYNDVLSKTQVLRIPNSFYRNKKEYNCGVNKVTGDINGLQGFIVDEG